MACRGYKVTIFEVKEKIGGIMRYGIPEFRLPKSILDRYYVKMKELGILFIPILRWVVPQVWKIF